MRVTPEIDSRVLVFPPLLEDVGLFYSPLVLCFLFWLEPPSTPLQEMIVGERKVGLRPGSFFRKTPLYYKGSLDADDCLLSQCGKVFLFSRILF